MASVDWDGNMTHANFSKKQAISSKPRAQAKKKDVAAFFDSDDENDFVVMLPKTKKEESEM